MNNAQRALIIAAGLFLTIALITLVVNLFSSAQDGAKRAQDEFASIQTELAAQAFTTYDGTKLTGSQVLNAIRKFSNRDSFGIYVETGKHQNTSGTGPKGVWYHHHVVLITGLGENIGEVIKGGTPSGKMENATDEYHDDYINPSGSFESKLIYNQNQQIIGIHFKQR